jgi:hypothetical protein
MASFLRALLHPLLHPLLLLLVLLLWFLLLLLNAFLYLLLDSLLYLLNLVNRIPDRCHNYRQRSVWLSVMYVGTNMSRHSWLEAYSSHNTTAATSKGNAPSCWLIGSTAGRVNRAVLITSTAVFALRAPVATWSHSPAPP